MAKRDELMTKYAADLKRIGVEPDMDLLTRAVKACGPSIYNADAETVAASSPDEVNRVKQNFLMKRLGMTDQAAVDAAMDKALDKIGRSNRNKYRAVMYYLLATETGRTAKL